jgi:hypothetical protein
LAFQNLIYFKKQFLLFTTLDFWFFGTVPFTPVSWYLVAFIYSLQIYLLIIKINFKDHFILFIIIFCIIFWLISGSYQSFFFSTTIPLQYNTSWIMALPFFLIGILFRKHESRLIKLNLNNISLIILIITFIISSFFEHFIIQLISNKPVNGTGYLSTLFLVLIIFLFCLKNKQWGIPLFNKIGSDHSMYIYIFHV